MAQEENWAVAVVLAARGDVARLDASLQSVLVSIDVAKGAGRLDPDGAVVVVVHDAIDRVTGAVASRLLADAAVRSVVVACDSEDPGSLRRRGTDVALAELSDRRMHRCWFANADADTRVPPTWLLRHLDAAQEGVAAVAGPVVVDTVAPRRVLGRRRAERAVAQAAGATGRPAGANLGVRADAYLAAGGWSDDVGSADPGLWQRVRALGRPVVSTTRSTVLPDHRPSRPGARSGAPFRWRPSPG